MGGCCELLFLMHKAMEGGRLPISKFGYLTLLENLSLWSIKYNTKDEATQPRNKNDVGHLNPRCNNDGFQKSFWKHRATMRGNQNYGYQNPWCKHNQAKMSLKQNQPRVPRYTKQWRLKEVTTHKIPSNEATTSPSLTCRQIWVWKSSKVTPSQAVASEQEQRWVPKKPIAIERPQTCSEPTFNKVQKWILKHYSSVVDLEELNLELEDLEQMVNEILCLRSSY